MLDLLHNALALRHVRNIRFHAGFVHADLVRVRIVPIDHALVEKRHRALVAFFDTHLIESRVGKRKRDRVQSRVGGIGADFKPFHRISIPVRPRRSAEKFFLVNVVYHWKECLFKKGCNTPINTELTNAIWYV
ncbi:hypothetical protein SDC9_188104 [bioreactor metagenome]|uniref:Uncharacterized protein n=1 Tax=bioreactor metagenome TaxID=1076179 RepID=A0A645HPS0_9ZZZZ